jgi:uncharacterized protein YndB with AHSA1/START domain
MNPAASEQIKWPVRYEPAVCPIHVKNELRMNVSADKVWAWLIRAQLWPEWYENSSDVKFIKGASPDLQEGTRFQWKTFGATIESEVLEFIPEKRIAWNAKGNGIDAYHAWLFQELPNGCSVLTEETQHGWLARLGKLLMPNRMYKYHQLWLEELQNNASKGMPLNQ